MVRASLASVFIAATGVAMLPPLLVLVGQSATGSLTTGTASAAAFTLGNAVGQVVQGRLLGTRSPRRVLVPAGVLSTGACLVVASGRVSSTADLAVCCLLAGVTVPAAVVASRAALTGLEPAVRHVAYAALAATFQAALATGPLVAGAGLVLVGAAPAVVCAAGLLLVAPVLVPRRPAVDRVGATRPPLRDRSLLLLVAVAATVGMHAGVLAAVVPATAIDLAMPPLVGPTFAALAVGDIVGALATGAVRARHRVAAMVAALAALAPLLLASANMLDRAPLLVLLALLQGVAVGAVSVLLSSLLDRVASPTQVSATYALVVACTLVASATATALSGVVVHRYGAAVALVSVASVFPLVATAVVAGRRRFLVPS